MSLAYYKLYERLIKNKSNDYTEEQLTEMVDIQHEKGRLTDLEYAKLVDLIEERFK